MKKLINLMIIFFFVGNFLLAQTPQNSWNFLGGVTYPKWINHGYSYAGNVNYGGYLGIERNFSEHVGLRLQLEYVNLQGLYSFPEVISRVNSFSANFDLMYFFVPCEVASPYLTFGAGPTFYMLDSQRPNPFLSDNNFSYQFNGGLGIDWKLDSDLKLRTELNYHTVADNKFDGIDGPSIGGILGGPYKSYLSFNVGINYTLDQGELSKYCQLYSGIAPDMKDLTNYAKIEDLIVKHIPKEVTKEVVVEKPINAANISEKWVLVGVNFAFNSSKLTADSYPILYDAAKTLLKNPDVKIEVQGYTDNVGSESYNKTLSQKRADVVKNYLIGKGVAANRLSAVGFGESNPVSDNKTAEGRAINRRIEFKVQ